MKDLAKNIKDQIDQELKLMMNTRKIKLGLISSHNMLIIDLRKCIDRWYKEKVGEETLINT